MQKSHVISALSFLIMFYSFAKAGTPIPAFPGAQGFGSTTPGGRGGKVLKVTNLNDSGPGSLRDACSKGGARIIVFETGGTILLTKPLVIRRPYVTVAGQTAPGDGICLRGSELVIKTHDVVVRGLRVRVGATGKSLDGIRLAGTRTPAYNIIIDHCSVSWASDENMSTFRKVTKATFSWNIIAEAFNPEHQSFGMLLGKYGAKKISVHHNLFAHNRGRQPKIAAANSAEVINNVVYNYENRGTFVGDKAKVNIIGNVYIPGPNTLSGHKGIFIDDIRGSDMQVYVRDNIGPGRPENSGHQWAVVERGAPFRSDIPVLASSGIVPDAVEHVLRRVLKGAGALAPHRDPVDERIVNDVKNHTGALIHSQDEVGGWPELRTGTARPDRDGDGMPDAWEDALGLNADDPADANSDRDGDGYTNIEQYINHFFCDDSESKTE